ncbi:MAG: sigma-70 family RNA polymerase sigma factor [Planctomycetota bacterium]|nr:MAG: sigma-70 family RNA polymerase sigma factor [Planctomycetota bacterium]
MRGSRSRPAPDRVRTCVVPAPPSPTCVTACRTVAGSAWRARFGRVRDPAADARCPLHAMNAWESDLELVKRVLAGERAAIDEFSLRMQCVPLILASLNARRGRPFSAADTTDIAQDVFVLLWRKLDVYEGMSTLESWVFRFCHYEFLNALRRRQRARQSESIESGAEWTANAPRPTGAVAYARLHEILERLSPREASVIRAKHFDGLTFDEIGARLGIPPNTAKTHYYRGIERMRPLLLSMREEIE